MTKASEQQTMPAPPAAQALQAAATLPVDAETSGLDGAGEATADVGIGPDEAGTTPAVPLLAGHKGKLAIGVAATLGLMVYYGWREKRLAQTDPEEYARLQRIKAGLRSTADWPQPEDDGSADAAPDTLPAAGTPP